MGNATYPGIELQLFSDGTGTGQTATGQQQQQTKTYTEEEMKKIVSDQVSTRVKELNTKYGPAQRISDKLLSAYGMKSVDELEKEIDAALGAFRQQAGNQSTLQTSTTRGPDPATQAALKAQEIAKDASLAVEEAALIAKADYADMAQDPELRQRMREYAKKNEVSLETAYWALQGPTRAAKIREEARQQTLEEMKAKIARGGSLDDNVQTSGGGEKGLTSEERAAAQFMRISEAEYKELARETGDDGSRYNLDDFLRHREKGRGRNG